MKIYSPACPRLLIPWKLVLIGSLGFNAQGERLLSTAVL